MSLILGYGIGRRRVGRSSLPLIHYTQPRPRTSKLLQVMGNCGPHGADIHDIKGHVFSLLPNCTANHQPMDMEVVET